MDFMSSSVLPTPKTKYDSPNKIWGAVHKPDGNLIFIFRQKMTS